MGADLERASVPSKACVDGAALWGLSSCQGKAGSLVLTSALATTLICASVSLLIKRFRMRKTHRKYFSSTPSLGWHSDFPKEQGLGAPKPLF